MNLDGRRGVFQQPAKAMNQTAKADDHNKKEAATPAAKSKPKKQKPSSKPAATRLSPDLPKNLLSVNQVVNDKGQFGTIAGEGDGQARQ